MTRKSFVDEELLANKKSWREYFAAKMGFRNHWYAACFSHEIREGDVLPRMIAGEEVLLRRVNGVVLGIHDRCIHRGIKLSDKVECHTPDTISCWYHGFTYRWQDGMVVNIFGAPESRIIGEKKIRTYPVREHNGLVFVFIGDTDRNIPALETDVPPSFMAPLALEGEAYVVKSNWRLGPEGGIDEIHRYLHRESPLLLNTQSSLPLGHAGLASRDQFELVEEGDGPYGLIDKFQPDKMYFDATLDGEVVVKGIRFDTGGRKRAVSASLWMPGVSRIEGFPAEGMTLYEWYVPIDATTHRCFMTFTYTDISEAGRNALAQAFRTRWKPLAIDGFLYQDIRARESAQAYYESDKGWIEETLCEEDFMIMEWRKLASRRNRGIQAPEHLL
jgi:carbazole 1,9a-dioxygenase terminal dioxygenase component